MADLRHFFERCYVVSLRRRVDRYGEFTARLIDWPFATPELWPAVDGKLVPHPDWWKAGGGAWGCFRSHTAAIEMCLNEGVKSVLLLEDDAVPCEGFAARAAEFVAAVPSDWGMIYFGGQHLQQQQHPPTRINDHVVRPHNVNRTHAFALSRTGMEVVYKHLHAHDWKEKNHIDHHLGRIHARNLTPVYCPTHWLIGQAAGKSNISGGSPELRFWNGGQAKVKDSRLADSVSKDLPEIIAVIAPFRSGSSCIAGMLHQLGVSMGRRFVKPNKNNAKGFWEGLGLRNLCISSYREPRMIERNTFAERVHLLRRWAESRKKEGSGIIGAKHPTLCLMIPEMVEAWPRLKIIAVDRPVEESIASLRRAGWWRPAVARATIPMMIRRRDEDLQRLSLPALRIEYTESLAATSATVARLVEFCGIAPTEEQIAAAVAFVDPHLNHGVPPCAPVGYSHISEVDQPTCAVC